MAMVSPVPLRPAEVSGARSRSCAASWGVRAAALAGEVSAARSAGRNGERLRRGERGCGEDSVKRDQSRDERRQRAGNRDAGGERCARSGRRGEGMDLGAECLLDLGHRAGEFDPAEAGRQGSYCEAFALEPGCNRGNIGGGVGVSLGERRRRKPAMIVGRGGILQARELCGERLLLRGRGREQKQHPAEDLVGGRGAQVGCGRDCMGGLLLGMATAALLRQSPAMREAGADALTDGEVCAAATRPAKRLLKRTVASGRPKLRSCILFLAVHKLRRSRIKLYAGRKGRIPIIPEATPSRHTTFWAAALNTV